MLGLMIRDLMVQRKRLWVGILYCIIGPLIFRSMGQGTIVMVVVAVEYMILLTAFAYDEKYKVDATMVSLPITRDPLVLVRYLEVPVLAIGAMLFYMLVTGIGRNWMEGMFPTSWVLPATALLAASLMSGVYMPIIYRFGFVKARIFNMILLMVCVFIPTFTLSTISGSNTSIQMPAWITNMSEGVISAVLVLVSVVILLISCMISIRVFRKRQL